MSKKFLSIILIFISISNSNSIAYAAEYSLRPLATAKTAYLLDFVNGEYAGQKPKASWQRFIWGLPITLAGRMHYLRNADVSFLRRMLGMKKKSLMEELSSIKKEKREERKKELIIKALELTMGNIRPAAKILGTTYNTTKAAVDGYSIRIPTKKELQQRAEAIRMAYNWLPAGSTVSKRKTGAERRITKQHIDSAYHIRIRDFEEFALSRPGYKGAELTVIWVKEMGHWVPVSLHVKKGNKGEEIGLTRVYDDRNNLIYLSSGIKTKTCRRLYAKYGRIRVVKDVSAGDKLIVAGHIYYFTRHPLYKAVTTLGAEIVPLEIVLIEPKGEKRYRANLSVIYNKNGKALSSTLSLSRKRLIRLCQRYGEIRITKRINQNRTIKLTTQNKFSVAPRFIGMDATLTAVKNGVVISISISQGAGQQPHILPLAIVTDKDGRLITSGVSFSRDKLKKLYKRYGEFFITKKINNGGHLKIGGDNSFYFGRTLNGELKNRLARCTIGNNGVVMNIEVDRSGNKKPYVPGLILITNGKGKNLHSCVNIAHDILAALFRENNNRDIVVIKRVPKKGGFWLGHSYFYFRHHSGAMATMIIGENGVVKDIVLYKKGRKPYRPTLRLVFTEDGELVSSSARMHSSKLEKLTATYGELIVCTTDKRPAYKIGKAAKKTSLSTEELERLIKQLKKKIEDLNEIAKSIKEKPSLTELYTQIDVIFYRVYTLYELLGFDNTLYKQMRVYWITALSKQRNLIQGQAGSKKEKNTAGGEMDKRNNISRIIIAMKDLEDLLGIIEDDGAADQEGLVEQEPALRSSILRLRADVKEAGDEELRRRLEKIETLFRRLFNIDFEAEEDLKVEQKIYNAINMAA